MGKLYFHIADGIGKKRNTLFRHDAVVFFLEKMTTLVVGVYLLVKPFFGVGKALQLIIYRYNGIRKIFIAALLTDGIAEESKILFIIFICLLQYLCYSGSLKLCKLLFRAKIKDGGKIKLVAISAHQIKAEGMYRLYFCT